MVGNLFTIEKRLNEILLLIILAHADNMGRQNEQNGMEWMNQADGATEEGRMRA